MQPLQDLLHRIKWDRDFGAGDFAIGYYDRVEHEEKVIPFTAIALDRERPTFSIEDEDGRVVHIPLHRVRTVYKDGLPIWHREHRDA
jgi:uncharacterized protein (UPF0248 family)